MHLWSRSGSFFRLRHSSLSWASAISTCIKLTKRLHALNLAQKESRGAFQWLETLCKMRFILSTRSKAGRTKTSAFQCLKVVPKLPNNAGTLVSVGDCKASRQLTTRSQCMQRTRLASMGLFVHNLACFAVAHRPYDKLATALHSTTKQLVLAHVLSANQSPRRSDSSYTSGSKGKHDETPRLED